MNYQLALVLYQTNPDINVPSYYLFIDTETSGLPKSWSAPYHKENNWPYIVQLAWVIFDDQQREIKRQNHFIRNTDFRIEKSSQKIHQISEAFLELNGGTRESAIEALNRDLKQFNPLVIGHFMEFDYHMVNAEYYRTAITPELNKLDFFCTMKASAPFVTNPSKELLKLNEFYELLFDEQPEAFHQALADALNTAKVFFELIRIGQITPAVIKQQNNNFALVEKSSSKSPKGRFLQRLFSF